MQKVQTIVTTQEVWQEKSQNDCEESMVEVFDLGYSLGYKQFESAVMDFVRLVKEGRVDGEITAINVLVESLHYAKLNKPRMEVI